MRPITLLLSLFTALSSTSVLAQDQLLMDIRKNIGEVFVKDTLCYRFEKRFEKADLSDNTLLGYKGAVWMAKGRHAANPMNKLSFFNQGKALLEKALVKEPENIELRFLRLTIQVNVPAILGYSSNKASDLAFVESKMGSLRIPELRLRMEKFISKARQDGKL